jgi:hypothetical protein
VPSLFHLTFCTPTESNLYLSNSLATVVSETDLYRPLTFRVPNCVHFPLLRLYQRISPDPRHTYLFHNKASINGEELLAPCPTPKLEDHPLLAVFDCLFSIFTATLHMGDHTSICNLRTCHAMVTGPLITVFYILGTSKADSFCTL